MMTIPIQFQFQFNSNSYFYDGNSNDGNSNSIPEFELELTTNSNSGIDPGSATDIACSLLRLNLLSALPWEICALCNQSNSFPQVWLQVLDNTSW